MLNFRLRVAREGSPLSDSEFVGRFQRRAAAPADDRGTVAAGQWVIHLCSATRAIERARARFRRRALGACRHAEENCSIEGMVASCNEIDKEIPIDAKFHRPLLL